MPRPRRTPILYSHGFKFLNKDELNSILQELNIKYKYQKLETKYENLTIELDSFYNLIVYRFNVQLSNYDNLELNDELFDLTFYLDNIDNHRNKIILNNNIVFNEIFKKNINKSKYEKLYDINLIKTLENRYVEIYPNYNKKECNEIMRKSCYLINEFIKNNPDINVYVIGKNIKTELLERYMKVFSGIFSNDYKIFEGTSSGYNEGAIYFINKKILIDNIDNYIVNNKIEK